jgi:DNA-binding IclR family transcriptional regulator
MKRRSDNGNTRSQSLLRGLMVLEAVAEEPSEIGIRELSRVLGLNATIVHRLARTLLDRGYVEQNVATLRYGIGVRAFQVGSRYRAAVSIGEAAHPVLSEVARTHELNCYLGMLDRGFVTYLVAVQSAGPVVIRGRPGTQTHVHSTALGKVLLAAESAAAPRAILRRGRLPPLTPRTEVSPDRLLAQLPAIRQAGYAVSDEENLPGVFAVGAPVREGTGGVRAAISVACPRYRGVEARIPEMARIATRAATAVSQRLGAGGAAEPAGRRLRAPLPLATTRGRR